MLGRSPDRLAKLGAMAERARRSRNNFLRDELEAFVIFVVDTDVNIPTLARQLCRQVKHLLWRRCELGVMVSLHSGLTGSGSASSTPARVLLSF